MAAVVGNYLYKLAGLAKILHRIAQILSLRNVPMIDLSKGPCITTISRFLSVAVLEIATAFSNHVSPVATDFLRDAFTLPNVCAIEKEYEVQVIAGLPCEFDTPDISGL